MSSEEAVRPQEFEIMMLREDGDDLEAGEGCGECEPEGEQARIRNMPELPSKLEVDKHYAANHVPFRNWCKHCIMGKAVNNFHKKLVKEEDDPVPTVSMDYGYLVGEADSTANELEEEEDKGKHMPTLFSVCNKTGYTSAHVMPQKGVHPYAVRRMAQNLDQLGHKKLNFKTDQEPAILALRAAVAVEATADCIIPEASPVGESQANGEVEGAVRMIKAQVRTMRLSLQSRYNREIKEDHNVIPWLVPEAAASINRYQVGADGKTRRERLKGKKWIREVAEFAECIFYKELKRKGKSSWEERWKEGIWLGIREESGEILVGTKQGVVKARSFERKSTEEERWNPEWLDGFIGVPWEPIPGSRTLEIPVRVRLPQETETVIEFPESQERRHRDHRFKITKGILSRFGYTVGCKGCSASNAKDDPRLHTEGCRERISRRLFADGSEVEQKRMWSQVEEAGRQLEELERSKRARTGTKEGETELGAPMEAPNSGRAESSGANAPEEVEMEAPKEAQMDLGELMCLTGDYGTAEELCQWEEEIVSQQVRKRKKQWDDDIKKCNQVLEDSNMTLIHEIYSPKRVNGLCQKLGLVPGMSLDLTTSDHDGRPWDFNDPVMRYRAEEMVRKKKALLIVGSPMCTAFSQLQNINFCKMSPEDVRKVKEYGIRHLHFCLHLYRLQMANGLYFMHEHPLGASSWKLQEVQDLLATPGVSKVSSDMCEFGMELEDH